MLDYLLIIFIVALALAPLTHFIPGKRQREIASMREFAAVHGLFVEFRKLPARVSADGGGRNMIYYGKRLPGQRVRPVQAAVWIRRDGDWVGVDHRLPVPGPLRDLPVELLAASVDPFSCGVYWMESSGLEGVERIRQALECWSQLLAE